MSYSDTMYHQYKSLTSCVVSWLVATGAGAGCPTSLIQPSPENKTTANAYQLQLAKFVPLTEWIKDCKESVHVPRSILKDLDRVIDLRLRYSRALRGSRQPTADDDSHGYFVDVLRKLQKVLRRFPTAQSKKKATLESSMSAIFSVLEMEDMSDKEESDAVERQEFLARVGKFDTIPTLYVSSIDMSYYQMIKSNTRTLQKTFPPSKRRQCISSCYWMTSRNSASMFTSSGTDISPVPSTSLPPLRPPTWPFSSPRVSRIRLGKASSQSCLPTPRGARSPSENYPSK